MARRISKSYLCAVKCMYALVKFWMKRIVNVHDLKFSSTCSDMSTSPIGSRNTWAAPSDGNSSPATWPIIISGLVFSHVRRKSIGSPQRDARPLSLAPKPCSAKSMPPSPLEPYGEPRKLKDAILVQGRIFFYP